ncbi:MAG: peptidoglycan/xylan/chitin deacetylase (PgdA/CDA1 family) [Halobacteriales archaeon]|jgi:peptidoglycan/xylan/chitin deacetylase (PgdA/CDA1 family)
MGDATVCLSFDFDAVSPWIHIDDGRGSPANRSRGLFGAEVGAPRLLDVLDERDVEATWFVPGHTIESFPDVAGTVVDRGHEIGHHGWSHTPPGNFEDRSAERRDLERGIEIIEDLTGERPDGYRSPSWDYSEHTLDLLLELGFEWVSNGMARDFEPYYARDDRAPADGPYERGEPTDLLEVPISWHRDDYPWLAFSEERSKRSVADLFDEWRRSLEWMLDNVADGVFVLTMHPQVMGRTPNVAHLDEFIADVKAADATLRTVGGVAMQRKQGNG